MTLEEFRLACGISKRELSRIAKVDYGTLQRAMNGELISLNSANRLALALSKALGKTVRIEDIDGIKVGR